MATGAAPGGLLAALRGLLATLLELAEVRLDLLGTELELEKRRLFDALLLTVLALVLLAVGLLAICTLVLALLGEQYRFVALGAIGMTFLVSGAWAMHRARHLVHNRAGLFADSLSELERDRMGLTSGGPDA